MDNLKPCPICGSKIWKDNDKNITLFKCLFCGAVISFESDLNEEGIAERFNRRQSK